MVDRWSEAAERGDAEAQYQLALCYANDPTLDENEFNALKWFTKAAWQGHTKAQHRMGLHYSCARDWGAGWTHDASKAVEWFTKAAAKGYVHSQVELAACYALGLGVHQDMAKAIEWYSKAAAQGDSYAQKELAALRAQCGLQDPEASTPKATLEHFGPK